MDVQDDSRTLQDIAERVLSYAKQHGASAAETAISQGNGLSVSVRQGEVETVEYNRDNGLGLTVYFGQSKASASSSDFSEQALKEVVLKACSIAKYSQQDPYAGLADAKLMAKDLPELDNYHPWALTTDKAIELAGQCEQAGLDYSQQITNSEGATVFSYQGQRVYANSHGFIGENQGTRHSLSCALISQGEQGMQRSYDYDIKRDGRDLRTAIAIGRKAAEKTISRLNPKVVTTGIYPVIFSSDIAPSLIGQFVSGIKGSALYRRSSFLIDQLGQQIFPSNIDISEQPHLTKSLGGAAFDSEGVATQERHIIEQGILKGYVLDSYSARKLEMDTTANAGGVHNLTVNSHGLDFPQLLAKMGRGVLITETMGMGINIVTGDYSQGAAGFWVENGEIQYPIDEFTIAGNLKTMLMGISAISTDTETRGNIRTGSILIDKMTIAA